MAFVYFDQSHCGYLLEKDLEEIMYTLGLHLSRAQVSLSAFYWSLMSSFRRELQIGRKLVNNMTDALFSGEEIVEQTHGQRVLLLSQANRPTKR